MAYLPSAGFCVAYLIFIGQNLTTLTNKDPAFFILAAGPILVALAMLRGVHALAPFSLIADAANICGALQQLTCLLFGTHTCQALPGLGLASSLCVCDPAGLHIQHPSARLLRLSPSLMCPAKTKSGHWTCRCSQLKAICLMCCCPCPAWHQVCTRVWHACVTDLHVHVS